MNPAASSRRGATGQLHAAITSQACRYSRAARPRKAIPPPRRACRPTPPIALDHMSRTRFSAGGRLGSAQITVADDTNVVEEYDPAMDQWVDKGRAPIRRSGSAGGVFDGKIYVAGGEYQDWEGAKAFWAVQSFDPTTGRWDNLPRMHLAHHGFAADFIGDERGGLKVRFSSTATVLRRFRNRRDVTIGDIGPERMQGAGRRTSYNSIRTDAHRRSDRSRTHFEDHVERRLGRAAEPLEARFSRDLAQSAFSRLSTEPQGHFLRERCRCANECRSMIEDAPDRIEIVLQIVMSKRLNDHPRPVVGQRFFDMLARAHGVTHVM